MTSPTDPSYTAQALRTESPITPALQTRLQQQARLVHALLGLQTEAGELADPVKKHIYYGRPLDLVNLREEIGDCLWYLAIACDALGTTLEAEQARNLAKLRARYPHVFTAEAAQVRDLDRERQVLEGNDLGTLLEQSQRVVSDAFSEVNSLRQQLDAARAEVETLRKELDAAKRAASDEITERQVLTVEQQQDAAIWQQQLDAANAMVVLQRAGIERLNAFVEKVRDAHHFSSLYSIERALAQLDETNSSVTLTSLPAPVAKPATCPECERLQAFVGRVRELLAIPLAQISYDDMSVVRAELAALDDEPTPVAEPLDAEGGQ